MGRFFRQSSWSQKGHRRAERSRLASRRAALVLYAAAFASARDAKRLALTAGTPMAARRSPARRRRLFLLPGCGEGLA